MKNLWWLGMSFVMAVGPANAAEPLQAESYFTETLGPSTPHWVVVNDMNFIGYMDSKIYLFDGDSGAMLGMLSAGGWRGAVELAADFSEIYSPETYYERGTRGERTDVITVYDTTNLEVLDEIVIPAKRATGMPHRGVQRDQRRRSSDVCLQHDASDFHQCRRRESQEIYWRNLYTRLHAGLSDR